MNIMAPGNLILRVPELLEERGWNITEFSEKAGISYPTALRFAHGDVHSVSLEMLDKLCQVFGVSVEEMVVREKVGS